MKASLRMQFIITEKQCYQIQLIPIVIPGPTISLNKSETNIQQIKECFIKYPLTICYFFDNCQKPPDLLLNSHFPIFGLFGRSDFATLATVKVL